MYLSVSNCFKLDEIIKSFEVAYRSHIVCELVSRYTSLSDFSIAINKLEASFQPSSIIFTPKNKGKLKKIKSEISDSYNAITKCYDDFVNQDYTEHNVPYVGEIIEYVNFFFNNCFNDLTKGFTTIEEFKDYSTKFYLIRNSLSHPASSKIIVQLAKEVISFIKKQLLNIEDAKFWFVTKRELSRKIEELVNNIEFNPIKIHNIENIGFNHKKLIRRDIELDNLRSLIFGKDESYRKSGSVIIYGYGGVGKTALVLEFIYQTLKEIFDNSIKVEFDFVLFYTSKEEVLSFSEMSGKLYINEIKKQIGSFDDFKSKVFNDLQISNEQELRQKKGLIIVDNFENISVDDKAAFLDFIKQSPRSIQYILTSRNEEMCEDKIHLREFKEIDSGIQFINEYVIANNYDIDISVSQQENLIKYSKGNTLIIVLSIEMLKNGSTISEIIADLINIESSNIEIIADFMYKNTISQAINLLEEEGHAPINMLKVISLNEFPVDLYSISLLSNISISSVEYMCGFLTTKLILEKRGESYSLNEFANKFIFIKYLPDKVETREIKYRILNYQKNLNDELLKLEVSKKKVSILQEIMDDWMPKTKIDEIAIASAFALFSKARIAIKNNKFEQIETIKGEFEKNEKMTSHPYIKFQKARTLQLFLPLIQQNRKRTLIEIISRSYEESIEVTDFYYPYIKNTKSYGSINWLYGIFLSSNLNDNQRALRYLEDSVEVFKRLKIKDKSYFKILKDISLRYMIVFRQKNDSRYLNELKLVYNEMMDNEDEVKAAGVNFEEYRSKFGQMLKQNTRR
jgi:Txe/YoeB family toxin of Txe-Axe toxin-antitoxin module